MLIPNYSPQAKLLIKQHQLVLVDLEDYTQLDVCFDGADEVDSSLVLIKGGGGCLTQEKIVAFASNELIIVADYRKNSVKLGSYLLADCIVAIRFVLHRLFLFFAHLLCHHTNRPSSLQVKTGPKAFRSK